MTKGIRLVLSSNWWSQSQRGITFRYEGGGAYHAIVGTVQIALICAVIAVPTVLWSTEQTLILVSYAVGIKFSPLSTTMASLPTMINEGRSQAQTMPGYEGVWGAALTLILIVVALNLLARGIARAGRLKEK